jgi:hypothetical protein
MPNATPEETRRLVDALPEEALLRLIWEILDHPRACKRDPRAATPDRR